jgi:ABC-type sugar transport system ATPase subunit
MTPLLETRNISKSFSGQMVLVNLSITVFSGEVHALMGESGASKSTLMKIMAGVHKPDSGEVLPWRRLTKEMAVVSSNMAVTMAAIATPTRCRRLNFRAR